MQKQQSDKQDLYGLMNQISPLPQQSFTMMMAMMRRRSYKKGDFILLAGDIQQDLYFIQEGIQMSYYQDESSSAQHVMAFTYPPNACAVPESFLLRRPSPCSIMCLTDTEALALSHTALQELYDKAPGIERFFRISTELLLTGILQRHRERNSLTIEERYLQFARRSAHLLNKVPHKYIASYLDINPTNFSKLYNSIRI
jgi:CRP-like cAMP-binding protein